jgi:hypothetical protein
MSAIHYCARCNRTPVLAAGLACVGCRRSVTPRHTCDTAPSGSERGNTCSACHVESARSKRPKGLGDITAGWMRQVGR